MHVISSNFFFWLMIDKSGARKPIADETDFKFKPIVHTLSIYVYLSDWDTASSLIELPTVHWHRNILVEIFSFGVHDRSRLFVWERIAASDRKFSKGRGTGNGEKCKHNKV